MLEAGRNVSRDETPQLTMLHQVNLGAYPHILNLLGFNISGNYWTRVGDDSEKTRQLTALWQ